MIAQINGLDIHYEVSGNGPPILLLHGNGENIGIFDELTEQLKDSFTVYAMDTRGHGKSGAVGSYHYEDMVEDVISLISGLDIKHPVLYGFSDGGIVGLMLASKYPDALSGLIASGANMNPGALSLSFRTYVRLSDLFKRDPLVKMMLEEPNITDEELEKIKIPVLLTVGSKDIIPYSHTKRIADAIPNCEVVVAENEDHSSYIVHSEKLYGIIATFLNNFR